MYSMNKWSKTMLRETLSNHQYLLLIEALVFYRESFEHDFQKSEPGIDRAFIEFNMQRIDELISMLK